MSRLATLATWATLAALPLALPAQRARAQSDAKPNIAVLYFDNSSFGKARADFDGLGKGIADLLINDLAAQGKYRVVERDRIQALLEEQKLVTSGAVDAGTAVKLGKLLGVHYMITGTFIADPKSRIVLTARAVDMETGVITNPQKVQSNGDDALALVAELSERLQKDLKLSAKELGGQAPEGTKQSGGEAAASAGSEPSSKSMPVEKTSQPAGSKVTGGAKKSSPARMDVRTTLLYAKALDAQDRGNAQQATELYRAVLKTAPDYEPAKTRLAKLEKARG